MFIACEDKSGWEDYFLILEDDIYNIDQLQEYVQNKMPIKCSEVEYRPLRSIVLDENLSGCKLVYLNNYNKIREPKLYWMESKQYDQLTQNQCNNCSLKSDWGCGGFKSFEVPICNRFEESVSYSFKEWIKSKFK